jgi:predicted dehydrogenase
VLLDLASHHADLLRWFLNDEVADVVARLVSEATEDDTAWLSFTMRGGVQVQSFFSFRAGRADFLEFAGERGTLRVDRHRTSLALRLSRRSRYGVRSAFVRPRWETLVWRMHRLLRPSYEPSYGLALAAFAETLRGRPPRGATLTDGVRSLETILRAEESARTGRPVAVHSGPA